MTVTIDDSERGSGGGNGDAPDLISRYQDHVSRKITSARETREIYDRLLSRVASGELDPRALDRELNSFLQINGPAYAARIADLSVRFLAGLVRAGGGASSGLFDEMAPGASQPRSHARPTWGRCRSARRARIRSAPPATDAPC